MKGKMQRSAAASGKPAPVQAVPEQKYCVYCGRLLPESPLKVPVRTRGFHVCSEGCREQAEQYVRNDKKLKLVLYSLILIAAMLILAAAVSANGMRLSYLAQIVAGAGFLLFPYPISSFETFLTCPIRMVKLISRGIGILFIGFGMFLFLYA